MTFLLDTHAFLWYLTADHNLGSKILTFKFYQLQLKTPSFMQICPYIIEILLIGFL